MTDQPTSSSLPRAFWPTVVFAAVFPTVATWLYFVVFKDTPTGKALHLSLKGVELLLPALATVFLFRERMPNFFARENWSAHWRSVPAGVGFGLAVVGLGIGLLFFSPIGPEVRASGEHIRENVEAMGVASWFWTFAVIMSVAHAALEEYYWRWFVFGNLDRAFSRTLAHVLAAVAFTGHHVVVLTQFFPVLLALFLSALVGIGGLVWTVLYRRQGSLMGAWVSHMLIDFGIMGIGWYLMMQ